jgi:hypothetical protein
VSVSVRLEDGERLDLAVYAAIAQTPTPELDDAIAGSLLGAVIGQLSSPVALIGSAAGLAYAPAFG